MFFLRSSAGFTIIFLLAVQVRANSGAAEKTEEKTEGTHSLEAQNYSGTQSFEWEKIQVKLSSLKGKLEAEEAVVKGMILEKSHMHGGPELSHKIEELKKEHSKLEKLARDYDSLNQEFQGKFPEKGLKETRIYKRAEVSSPQAATEDLSLQGRINRLQTLILKQYPKSGNAVLKSREKPKKLGLDEEKKDVINPNKKKSKDVTDPIVLEQ